MVFVENAEIVVHEVNDQTVWQHVKLTSEGNLAGFGEYTWGAAVGDLDAYAGSVAEQLVGREIDGFTGDGLAEELGGSFPAWTVASALDQALEDLRARQKGLPLARHISESAALHPIPLYANINRRTRARTPESFSTSARDALNAGFDAIKIAPFDGLSPDICESPEGETLIAAGLERIRAVQARIAGSADLMVDCHWRFTFDRAMSVMPELADLGVVWFECPIPETPAAVSDLRRLRTACLKRGMRLAGCEMMNGLTGFRPYIEGEAYDVIMPDVKYAGGLSEVIRIAEFAETFDIACSIHNPSGPIAHMFSVHVAAAMGSGERLEYQFDETPLFFQIVQPEPSFVDGKAVVPETAGLGMDLVNPGHPG